MDENINMKTPEFIQTNIFGDYIIPYSPPKKTRAVITEEEQEKRKEKSEAHTAWKLLKSRKFKDFSDRHKFLLQKYYKIEL